jgi:hypothetical protein
MQMENEIEALREQVSARESELAQIELKRYRLIRRDQISF